MKAVIALPPPEPARLEATIEVLARLLVDKAISTLYHSGGSASSNVVDSSGAPNHDGHQDPG